MSKKKTARSRFYGLPERPLPLKCVAFVDFDYVEKLSEEEKGWLASFSRAYYLDSRAEADVLGEEAAAIIKSVSSKGNWARRRDLANYAYRRPLEAADGGNGGEEGGNNDNETERTEVDDAG